MEKISSIEQSSNKYEEVLELIYNPEYSEEDKNQFNEWLKNVPSHSYDKPLQINETTEILKFLPSNAKCYEYTRVNLYFQKSNFGQDELETVFKNFSESSPSFEISITKHSDNLISIGIGDKFKNSSVVFEGEYFGHYHPVSTIDGFKLENNGILPKCFLRL